jgi:hypothetical protein
LQLFTQFVAITKYTIQLRPHPIPSRQTVLILNEFRQRHEQNPRFRPTSIRSHGKYLAGQEAGFTGIYFFRRVLLAIC